MTFPPQAASSRRILPRARGIRRVAKAMGGQGMSQSERPSDKHALVIGGGTMGVGIIAMFLGHGWKVDVVSRSAGTRDGLPAATAKALSAMGKATNMSGLKTY